MGSNTAGKKSAALVWAIAPKSIQCPAHERSDTPIYVFHEGVFLSGFRSRGGPVVVVVVFAVVLALCVWVCRSHFIDANASLCSIYSICCHCEKRGKEDDETDFFFFTRSDNRVINDD